MPLAEAKKWLLELPGVGPKTVGCVLLFSLGMPAMIVDTHVHRVAKRLNLIGAKVSADDAHDILEAKVPPDDVLGAHIYIIAHGRQVCKAQRPLCDVFVSWKTGARPASCGAKVGVSEEGSESQYRPSLDFPTGYCQTVASFQSLWRC